MQVLEVNNESSTGNWQDASHSRCLETFTLTNYTNFYF